MPKKFVLKRLNTVKIVDSEIKADRLRAIGYKDIEAEKENKEKGKGGK